MTINPGATVNVSINSEHWEATKDKWREVFGEVRNAYEARKKEQESAEPDSPPIELDPVEPATVQDSQPDAETAMPAVSAP